MLGVVLLSGCGELESNNLRFAEPHIGELKRSTADGPVGDNNGSA